MPPDACVGAVLDPDEWAYPLWGPKLRHRIEFLPSVAALATAVQQDISYVVVSSGANAPVADQFTRPDGDASRSAAATGRSSSPRIRAPDCETDRPETACSVLTTC